MAMATAGFAAPQRVFLPVEIADDVLRRESEFGFVKVGEGLWAVGDEDPTPLGAPGNLRDLKKEGTGGC